MQEVEVLRVVVEAENSLHAASADAQPGLKFVLSVSPIELRIPISQPAQIAVVELRADAESVCNLGRCVHAEIRELTAAYIGGLHGEPVVVVGVNESLGGKAVNLNFPAIDLEILGVQAQRGEDERKQRQANRRLTHLGSSPRKLQRG